MNLVQFPYPCMQMGGDLSFSPCYYLLRLLLELTHCTGEDKLDQLPCLKGLATLGLVVPSIVVKLAFKTGLRIYAMNQ